MLRTFFLTSLRSVRRDATVSAINLVGMAVGLACCLIIGLFVLDELRFDRHHDKADRVVRIVADMTAPDTQTDRLARTSRPVADALRDQFPQLERVVRLVEHSPSIRLGDEYLFDHVVFYAEPEAFEIFTLPVIAGDARSALSEPYTAAITRSFAAKIFGHTDVLSETLVLNDSIRTTITAVLQDNPPTSHLQFDLLLAYATFEILHPAPAEAAWLEMNSFTYALLKPGADVEALRSSVRDLAQREYGAVLETVGVRVDLHVERLRRIYLHSDRQAQLGPTSDARLVGLFGLVAIIILLIACINYTNLATARSMQRAREVGVRKALGAGRRSLIIQFLLEATLLTAFAMALALFLVAASIGWFNELAGKSLEMSTLIEPGILTMLVAVVITVGLLAGIYPALVLSRCEAAQVVRGQPDGRIGGAGLRRVLVVVQFAASIILIAATLAAVRQLDYMRSQDLGFDAEDLLVLRARNVPASERIRRFETARDEIRELSGIRSATAAATTPGDVLPLLLTVGEGLDEGDSRRMHYVFADEKYAATYGLRLLAGRLLSPDLESDRREKAIINESAVAALGWGAPQNAIGRWVHMGTFRREVVGVIEDYHHFALRQPVEPMVMMVIPSAYSSITARIEPDDLQRTLAELRSLWNAHFPGYPFDYSFVTDAFETQYAVDRRLSVIMSLFAGLAIFIASLGLFGLVAYTTSQRRREIGVRKTMGASVSQIVVLLMRSVVGLVAVAVLVALPVAYFGLRAWLDGFPYPADLGASIFISAGVIVLTIALITVSSLAARAATANPTRALRSE